MLERFEPLLIERIRQTCEAHPDPSHDLRHVERVVAWGKRLAKAESAQLEIAVPAAYLHDVVMISKSDPRRTQASRLSAAAAVAFLREIEYPEEFLPGIAHAIEAHSFSAGITATTLEAKIVQDADRLDGLGAIGVMRCLSLGGTLARNFYAKEDPFCENRPPNDAVYTIDHFYAKLLKVSARLHTASARAEGARRLTFMQDFLSQLRTEINAASPL